MKKYLIRAVSLALMLVLVLCVPVVAHADNINLGVKVEKGTDTITVTVDNSTETNNILAAQTPTLTVPCDFIEADVKYGEEVIPSTLAEGKITFTVTRGGTYTIVRGEHLVHTGGTATCKDKAICTVCKEPYGELDATNHAGGTEIRDDSAATCTVNGYTGDTYCVGCSTKLADGETITAQGHEMGGWTATEVAGEERRDCSNCDHYETRNDGQEGPSTPSTGGDIGSGTPDGTPPVLQSITLSKTEVTAPGTIEITVDATDDVSGVSDVQIRFWCEATGKELVMHAHPKYYDNESFKEIPYPDGKLHGTLEVDQYVETGTFIVKNISIGDIAGNRIWYERNVETGSSHDRVMPEAVKKLKFEVVNTVPDVTTSVAKPEFVEQVEKAENDAYIVADYSGNATLPEGAFDAIAGTDKTLDLVSEGVTWRFEGSDIVNEPKPIDLQVQITKVEEETTNAGQQIQEKLEDAPAVVMKFAENGTLPGKATIQVKIDYAMREYLGSSKKLCVYYFNNQTGELELVAKNLSVINDTYVEFPITHCSYYVLAKEPELGNGKMLLRSDELVGESTVWINGLPVEIKTEGSNRYITLPTEDDCMMVTYSYHVGTAGDVHTQYPTGMKVYRISDGKITYIPELDNLLQYSGSSIRITGKKGIRMITSMYQKTKASLVGGGLAGYKLVENGTMLCWSSEIPRGDALVLGKSYTRSNYAYKRGVADPVFATSGNLTQYTNVLVGFTNEQCKDDIAMRPYIILEDANGEQFTLYGGTIHRSIGYIAYQNRKAFTVGSGAYNYVWDIIHYVYGNKYDADYKG